MKLLTLSCLVAVAEGMSSLAANATDIVKTPNPAWSRSPHMAPGMENEKGHVDVGGLPAPVEGQVPASPGVYRKANIHSRMPSGTDELIKNDPNVRIVFSTCATRMKVQNVIGQWRNFLCKVVGKLTSQ